MESETIIQFFNRKGCKTHKIAFDGNNDTEQAIQYIEDYLSDGSYFEEV